MFLAASVRGIESDFGVQVVDETRAPGPRERRRIFDGGDILERLAAIQLAHALSDMELIAVRHATRSGAVVRRVGV